MRRGLLVLLVGCAPGFRDLEVIEGELVTSTVAMRWESQGGGAAWVEIGLGDGPRERRVLDAETDALHEVRVAGLKPGRTYTWQPFAEVGGRELAGPVGTLEVAPAPSELPEMEALLTDAAAQATHGWVLTSLIEGFQEQDGGGWVVLLDGDGDVVWWFDTGHRGRLPPDLEGRASGWSGRSLPLSSGWHAATRSLTFSAYDLDQQADVATFRRVPVDALTFDEVVTTRLTNGHHDYVYRDGTVRYLAYDRDTFDGEAWVADAVVDIAEGTVSPTGIRPVWTWWDDGPSDPTVLHEAQEGFSFGGADFEWSHGNSLMEAGGATFLMSKFLDCIVKIDPASGSTAWILGGPFSDFTLPAGEPVWQQAEGDDPDSNLWSQAHMSDLWYDPASGTGGFVVFDNGSYRAEPISGRTSWSRLVAYAFDEEARTVEPTWEYRPFTPEGSAPPFTTLLGDVDRLDSSWLASWSILREPSANGLQEITEAGEVLWHVRPRRSMIVGRASFLEDLDTR